MLRSLFVLLIFTLGFAAALRSRYAALLMYLWLALFRPQEWLWIDITGLRLSLIVGIVLLVPSLMSGLFPDVTHPLSKGMILFLGASLLAQIGAANPDVGWYWIDFTVRLFLTCMLLVTLVENASRLVTVIGVVSASLGFHAAKAGLAWLLGGGEEWFAQGFGGSFPDNNGYALATVMTMPLLMATAQNAPVAYNGALLVWIRRVLYIAVPLCVFTVVGTYSRGGFLALSSAALMFILLQRRRFGALVGLLSVITILLAVVPLPQRYIDRLQSIRTYEEDGSALGRWYFWGVGIKMGMSRPFGVGLRQYEEAYDQYDSSRGEHGEHRAVHSSPVQVFAELGFFGAAVWGTMFGYAFVICLRVRRRSRSEHLTPELQIFLFTTANALMTSMTGFLVGGAFLSAVLNEISWLTFALIAALDRISAQLCAQPVAAAVPVQAPVPLAFCVVESYPTTKGGRA